MDHKEIIKLTKERLSNTKSILSKLNECKKKIEEAKILNPDKVYITQLNYRIKKYELELSHIRNAMEPLSDMEKQIITLNLFEGVLLKNVVSQFNISRTQVNRIKKMAIETIADILYY